MRLRKTIKKARFSDEILAGEPSTTLDRPSSLARDPSPPLSEAESSTHRSSPRKASRRQPAYRGPVVEYNPNLPPAAFPTIDSLDQSEVDVSPESLSSDCELPTSISSPSTRLLYGHSVTKSQDPSNTESQSPCITSADEDLALSDGELELDNPIRDANLQKIKEAGMMTDNAKFLKETETSEEEDGNTATSDPKATNRSPPRWEEISSALKLDLIDTVHGLFPDETETMILIRLDLNRTQWAAAIELVLERQTREAQEAVNGLALQREASEYLLTNHKRRLSQPRFRTMTQDHLYKSLDRDDFTISNRADVARAKACLAWSGYDPDLIVWGSPFDDNNAATSDSMILGETTQDPSLSHPDNRSQPLKSSAARNAAADSATDPKQAQQTLPANAADSKQGLNGLPHHKKPEQPRQPHRITDNPIAPEPLQYPVVRRFHGAYPPSPTPPQLPVVNGPLKVPFRTAPFLTPSPNGVYQPTSSTDPTPRQINADLAQSPTATGNTAGRLFTSQPPEDLRFRSHAVSLGDANRFTGPPTVTPQKRANTMMPPPRHDEEGPGPSKKVLTNGTAARQATMGTIASLAKTSELEGRQPARTPKHPTVRALKTTFTSPKKKGG